MDPAPPTSVVLDLRQHLQRAFPLRRRLRRRGGRASSRSVVRRHRGDLAPLAFPFPLSRLGGGLRGFLHRTPPGSSRNDGVGVRVPSPRGMAVGTRLAKQQQQQQPPSTILAPPTMIQQKPQGIRFGGAAAGVAPPSPRGMPMEAGPRLSMLQQQQPSTILAHPTTTQQKQRGIGFGGAAASVAPPPSPQGMPVSAGPRPTNHRKRKQPIVAPPQQKNQDFGGAGAGAAPVSSSARRVSAVAEKAAAAETEEEARARERAAEQIASVQDAISRLIPYSVFAEYERDEIYVEDQPPAMNKLSVHEWEESRDAMAEQFEKQVLIYLLMQMPGGVRVLEEDLGLPCMCLEEPVAGDVVRSLDCNGWVQTYHRTCVDVWLWLVRWGLRCIHCRQPLARGAPAPEAR